MDLFEQLAGRPANRLPCDGEVYYWGTVMSQAAASEYLRVLLGNIAWLFDEVVVQGQKMTTKRQVAFYGSHSYKYTYSQVTKRALPWVPDLLPLKALVEQCTGEVFNACLLNHYHNGSEGMAWHSDAERELKPQGVIASLSLGAERKFAFKHKATHQTCALPLAHGSLLTMQGTTQAHWLHSLPVTKAVYGPRVNLTFRQMAAK